MSTERTCKRRRTARACDSCRGLKAKVRIVAMTSEPRTQLTLCSGSAMVTSLYVVGVPATALLACGPNRASKQAGPNLLKCG